MTHGTILHMLVVRQLTSRQTLRSMAVSGPLQAERIQCLSRRDFVCARTLPAFHVIDISPM